MYFTHGHSRRGKHSKTYSVWSQMRYRCSNPKCRIFSYYGARGIRVCERWEHFENFLADMGEQPPGLTLDRIDNNKGYEPGNVRWATHQEQQENTRWAKPITFNGETKTLTAWAKWLGRPRSTLQKRFEKGWSLDRVLV